LTGLLSRWLGWGAALCLVFGCAGSAGSPKPKAATPQASSLTGELIDLNFAWPVGLTARVEYQETRESKTSQGVESLVFRSSHRMRVEPAGEDIRVIHDEFSLKPATSAEAAKSPRTSSQEDELETEPDAQVGDLLPDLIVDRTGRLVRIAGTERLRADAVERMSKGNEQSPESRARLERFIAHAVSDNALMERATRDWNALVFSWAGARFAVGVLSSQLGAGAASDPTSSRQLSVTPRVPCDASDRTATCVRIEFESHPAPEVRDTIVLVTEPDRLVPHNLRVGSEIHARMTRPDGKLENIDQSHAWSYQFTYSSGS
jgi:hypothetical protein